LLHLSYLSELCPELPHSVGQEAGPRPGGHPRLSVEVATPEEASNVVSGDDAEEKETTGEAVKRKAENEETKEEEEGSAEKISS